MFKAELLQMYLYLENVILKTIHFFLYGQRPEDFRPKHICIYRIGNIGDILCTIPALWAIRRKYPEARLTLLSSAGSKGGVSARDVLGEIGCLDAIELYDREDISRDKIGAFKKRIKALDFDYFIQIPALGSSFKVQVRNMFFFRAMGFKIADGFFVSISSKWQRARAQLQIMRPKEEERCLRGLPFQAGEEYELDYGLSGEDREIVAGRLREEYGNELPPIMAISFVSKIPLHAWLDERWAMLAQKWLAETGGSVALIGGKQQYRQAEEIIAKIKTDVPEQVKNFCGTFTIKQSMAFLEKVSVLATVDTGTAHMATYSRIPCVVVQPGSEYPNGWWPLGEDKRVIRYDQPCSPCLRQECLYGAPAKCMSSITLEEVWQNVWELSQKGA